MYCDMVYGETFTCDLSDRVSAGSEYCTCHSMYRCKAANIPGDEHNTARVLSFVPSMLKH